MRPGWAPKDPLTTGYGLLVWSVSVSCCGDSRRPAEGSGTAHVGTPSLGSSTRCRISQAAMKSRMESQSDIGYTTSSTPHCTIRMFLSQASQYEHSAFLSGAT